MFLRSARLLTTTSRALHTSAVRREIFENADAVTFARVAKGSGDKVVLVDWYADWCPPCKALTPQLEKVAKGPDSEVDLVKINTDEQLDLAREWKITALPTVHAFKKGKPVGQFTGAVPPPQLRQFIDAAGEATVE